LGLIRGDGRRGTFVGNSSEDRSSLAKLAKQPGEQTIDLSLNHPSSAYDPSINKALKLMMKGSTTGKHLQYSPPQGLLEHRLAGAKWISDLGLEVDPESVIITCGVQHALMVIFSALSRPGDSVATELHTYPGVKAICDLLGLNLIGIPMDADGIKPKALESLNKTRKIRLLYCNPTLQNPTTAVTSAERREAIAQIASKYGTIVIEDEILRPLLDNPPPFISSFDQRNSCLVISASKVISAGTRTGFLVAPDRFRQKLIDTLQTSLLTPPTLTTELIAIWLKDGTAARTIEKRKIEIIHRQKLAASILSGYYNPVHTESTHIWLILPEHWSAMEFTVEAQRRGVAVTPAEIFATDKKAAHNAVRLTLTNDVGRELLRKGLEIIRNLLDSASGKSTVTV